MSNVPEIFSNALNQSRAAAIERQQFDERMRMEEEKMEAERALRDFQMQNMAEQLRQNEQQMIQNKDYQNRSLGLQQANLFDAKYSPVAPGSRYAKELGGMDYARAKEYGGEGWRGREDMVYVDSAMLRDLMLTDRALAVAEAKKKEESNALKSMGALFERAYSLSPEFSVTGTRPMSTYVREQSDIPIPVYNPEGTADFSMPSTKERLVERNETRTMQRIDPRYLEAIPEIIEQMRLQMMDDATTRQSGINYETQIGALEDQWFNNLVRYKEENPSDVRFGARANALAGRIQRRYLQEQAGVKNQNVMSAINQMKFAKMVAEIQDAGVDGPFKEDAQRYYEQIMGR